MADTGSPFNIPYVEPTDLVRDYPAASQDLADRIADQFAAGFQYAGTRYYTSSGSFAKADPLGTGDIGLRAIRVRMVGGGGGSAGNRAAVAADTALGGGAGGTYAESFITNIAGLVTSVTVTRGAGGSGGTGGTDGGTGGDSSFGALVVADGGAGSSRQTNANATQVQRPGSGRVVNATGDIVIQGQAGTVGSLSSRYLNGGTGGSSVLGGGGRGATRVEAGNAADGQTGANYGAGAGGGASRNNTDVTGGAAGGNGIVIVDCFV